MTVATKPFVTYFYPQILVRGMLALFGGNPMSGYNTRLVDRVDLQCTLYFSAAETVSVSHSVSIRSTQRLMPFSCQLKFYFRN